MVQQRKIIHIDMDAYYASIEQRDNPDLKGKPVIVGGAPDKRGVVATCSYEARKFGIHSAMSSSRAQRLCPQGIFVSPRFSVYRSVSVQIMELFRSYTDLVEPLSLDEAFLDVTENKKKIPSATLVAREIKQQIVSRTRLTASAGVSFNKFLAKVASDLEKPDGLTVITPEDADTFIDSLPIGKFFGIGRKTEQRMTKLGISKGADLKKYSKIELLKLFGKVGEYYYNMAHALDTRPVCPTRIRKSIGKEITLRQDIDDRVLMMSILEKLAQEVETALKKQNVKGSTITLKVKYANFTSITRQVSLRRLVDRADLIMDSIPDLLNKTEAGTRKVRLLGISLSHFNLEKERGSDERQLIFPFYHDNSEG